ncbi:MAG TPA: M48 family metallopeptidase [Sedimentisphaerales bacterium]|nr:M48 family metallopeptidase [Sedimentisphaerales bacterium]
MKSALKPKVVVLLALALTLAGCTQVPLTGRQQLNLVPDSTINQLSFQSYTEFIQNTRLSSNAAQTQMVKRVGLRIQNAVERYCLENYISDRLYGYKWEFNLIEDPNVNAWAMPGGKVVVYTGLLPVTQTEAGLATVLGHEIAHAFARHGAERMTMGLLNELGGMALSEAMANSPARTKDLFLRSYGIAAEVGVLRRYSRVQESEADHLGLIFMALAGYNPNEALSFWDRMAVAQKGPQTFEILSTHPSDETRVRKIRELIPEAMRYYRPE